MNSFGLSWVDFAVALLLLWGVLRGRKRGMSEELLDVIKWGLIIVVAGAAYLPLGKMLSQLSVFSLLSSYLFVYVGVAALIFALFGFIRSKVGGKLASAEIFGNAEYYLGMMAGGFRYLCVILVGMALLNARLYSEADIRASIKYQDDNFGSHFFPTLPDIQQEVFKSSLCGKAIHTFIPVVLIKSTPSSSKDIRGTGTRVRARELEEVLDRK